MPRFLKVSPRLPVVDLHRTVAFYKDMLGFTLGFMWPADAPTFGMLSRDGVSVQFQVADQPRPEQGGQVMLSFDVDDAKALHATLEGRIPVEWGPEVYWYGRREFAVRDPSGYLVIFSEETPDPPTCHEEE
jgi:catechol 2,3-dioxygenase-like lactoylglutathione lyase family enzyme